jgi:endonuclease/exonuclease/phosphatase family metal-dependent hydrolase
MQPTSRVPDLPQPFRLLSYNILEGFRPVGAPASEQRALDRKRLDAASRLLVELTPDIVVLNEALFCREFEGRITDYAGLLGYPHHASALYDREWGNVILSRFPILDAGEMRIHNRGGLSARIATPEGPLTVASYHPHPGRLPKNKAADFTELIARLSGPLAVCGDFNCVSPEDTVDESRLLVGFRRFSPEPEAALARFLASGRAVFAVLARHGLRDAIPAEGRRYTIPTDLLSPKKEAAMRLDHIFVNSAVDVLHGEVLHSPLTHAISDHHPVLADLRLAP